MAAPPACHHEEYQLIGAGHVEKKTSDEAQTNRPEPGSYQSGNRRLYQQSHGSPDTDMKPTSEPMKEQNLKYFLNRK